MIVIREYTPRKYKLRPLDPRFIPNLEKGDCLVLLKDMASNSISLALTSPPYKTHLHRNGHQPYTNLPIDFGNMEETKYCELLLAALREINRVLMPNRFLIIIVGDETAEDGSDSGFPYQVGELCKKAGFTVTVQPTTIGLALPKYAIYCKKGKLTREDRDKIKVIRFRNVGKVCLDYEASFDMCIPLTLIPLFTEPGETVMDLFAGVGSTLIAANQLERHSLGFDINERAIEIYKKIIMEAGLSGSGASERNITSEKEQSSQESSQNLSAKDRNEHSSASGAPNSKTDSQSRNLENHDQSKTHREVSVDLSTESTGQPWMQSPSFLLSFIQYVELETDAPNEFAILTALLALGQAMDTDSITNLAIPIHHNLFILLIATTGESRKTTLDNILRRFGFTHIPYATEQTTVKYMARRGIRKGFLAVDEFSRLLGNLKRMSFMAEADVFYNDMFDCKPLENVVTIGGKDRVYRTPGEDTYVSMFAATTPESFDETITDRVLYGGTFNRLIVATAKVDVQPPKEKTPLHGFLESYLRRYISYISSFKYRFQINKKDLDRVFWLCEEWKKGKDRRLYARLDYHVITIACLLALDLAMCHEVYDVFVYEEPNPSNREMRVIKVEDWHLEGALHSMKYLSEQASVVIPEITLPKVTKAIYNAILRLYERGKGTHKNPIENRDILRSVHGLLVQRLKPVTESLETAGIIENIGNVTHARYVVIDPDALKGSYMSR